MPKELVHVAAIVEAARLYPLLRALELARAYNVEVRAVVDGGKPGDEAEAPATAPPRRKRGNAAPQAREKILHELAQAGAGGLPVARLIDATGVSRPSVYAGAHALLKAGQIERPAPGVYRLKPNGPGGLPHDDRPAEAPAVLPSTPSAPPGLSDKQNRVLALFSHQTPITTADVRTLFGKGGKAKSDADYALKFLTQKRLLRRVGRGIYERVI
jgi:hypothetical protein